MTDIWEALESPPQGCEDVADLYHWSTNYSAGEGPFTMFLDLIGWSDDTMGTNVYDYSQLTGRMGYVEIDKLADALKEYADRPHDVRSYVDELMELESQGWA